jgi:hypothetical protein
MSEVPFSLFLPQPLKTKRIIEKKIWECVVKQRLWKMWMNGKKF